MIKIIAGGICLVFAGIVLGYAVLSIVLALTGYNPMKDNKY